MASSSSIFSANLPDLTTDNPLYQKGFATYTALLDMPDILTYFANNISTFVTKITGSWRLLSIGCGDGRLDLNLLDVISRHFPLLDVEYVGLEPNQHRLGLFKEMISSYPSVSRYRLHLEQVDLDGYEQRYTNEQFDLILCARVLYYMHNRLQSTFIQLIDKLVAKGKLLAIHQSPSGLAQLIRVAGLDQQSSCHKCNTFDLRYALEKLARQRPSLHFSIVYLDGYVNITCLKNVNSNDELEREKALSLLSFFFMKILTGVDGNLMEKLTVERFLPAVSFPKEENSDTLLMFQPVGILVVELQ